MFALYVFEVRAEGALTFLVPACPGWDITELLNREPGTHEGRQEFAAPESRNFLPPAKNSIGLPTDLSRIKLRLQFSVAEAE